MNKDKAYHQIALACLKTLREGRAANSNDQVQELYQVIDQAFAGQFALLLTELEDAKGRLHQIEQLDPLKHSLADAQAIIQYHGTAH